MNIRSALICLDCDEVYDSLEYKDCPVCGSKHNVAITQFVPCMPIEATALGYDKAIKERRKSEVELPTGHRCYALYEYLKKGRALNLWRLLIQ